jgi:hypothetical protein
MRRTTLRAQINFCDRRNNAAATSVEDASQPRVAAEGVNDHVVFIVSGSARITTITTTASRGLVVVRAG